MPRRACYYRSPSISRRLPRILLTTPLLFSWPWHYPQKPIDTVVLLLEHNALYISSNSCKTLKKLHTCVTVIGLGQFTIAAIFFGFVSTPSFETTWPRYSNCGLKNSLLPGFSLNPASSNFSKTDHSHLGCSPGVFENMMMSSK